MTQDIDAAATIQRLVNGYQLSQAIHVIATLGIADLLAEGARRSDDLAVSTKAHPEALYRVLRAVASVDVLRELDDRQFELTALGHLLRDDVEGSIAGWAAYVGRPYYWAACGELLHSVRTGANAFHHVNGTDVWTFGRRAPSARGVLFDQAHVLNDAAGLLECAGVADRCSVVAGYFFDTVPAGADAYTMRYILHDWLDDDAARILDVIRRAIADNGRLVVVERLIQPPNEGPAAKFADLNMLVAAGGRERTHDQFAALFERAAFHLERVVPGGAHWVIEATPV